MLTGKAHGGDLMVSDDAQGNKEETWRDNQF